MPFIYDHATSTVRDPESGISLRDFWNLDMWPEIGQRFGIYVDGVLRVQFPYYVDNRRIPYENPQGRIIELTVADTATVSVADLIPRYTEAHQAAFRRPPSDAEVSAFGEQLRAALKVLLRGTGNWDRYIDDWKVKFYFARRNLFNERLAGYEAAQAKKKAAQQPQAAAKMALAEVTPAFVARLVDDFAHEQPARWKEWVALERVNEPIEDLAGELGVFVKTKVEITRLQELSRMVMAMRSELMGRIRGQTGSADSDLTKPASREALEQPYAEDDVARAIKLLQERHHALWRSLIRVEMAPMEGNRDAWVHLIPTLRLEGFDYHGIWMNGFISAIKVFINDNVLPGLKKAT